WRFQHPCGSGTYVTICHVGSSQPRHPATPPRGAGCSLGLRLPFSPKFLGVLLRHPGITLQLCSQLCSNKHLLPTCTIFDHSPHICQNEYNKYMYSFEVMSVATSIRLTDELEHRIKKLAATTGRSQSFYINQMIEDGIDRVEQIYGI